MRALGPSSELQKHLLKELSSAVFHLKNDLIVGELRWFFLDGLLPSMNFVNHDLYAATSSQRLAKISKLLNHDDIIVKYEIVL